MLAETICSAVSAAGLGIAAVTAYRRRFLTATRIAAYALVPVALVLTGAVEWVAGMVFKPSVWIGVGLLGVAWLLLMATRAVERRTLGRPAKQKEPRGQKEPRAAGGRPARDAVAPDASAPSLGAGPRPGRAPERAAAPADDFSDIEAILKKHGI
ncbi:hypothetical protein GCM10010347_35870 [Streptomyces cirratus]|uniref:Integral membrane protein n=1 Tax=Streptomyces cirratus TaxID=68187 RepID=A0ABQ3EWB9_9ACTN|nr:hypothetical protein [Streptomyces cirratus]GHB62748.1 hypothetical protein GCM10010347_35870 [Streptomyces cirratus]